MGVVIYLYYPEFLDKISEILSSSPAPSDEGETTPPYPNTPPPSHAPEAPPSHAPPPPSYTPPPPSYTPPPPSYTPPPYSTPPPSDATLPPDPFQPETEPPPKSDDHLVIEEECIKGPWSDWSLCDKECGGGYQYRTRNLSKNCPGNISKKETRQCNTRSCKQDCVLSVWSPWSECSKACNRGKKTRTRTIVTHPKYDGKPCLHLLEEQECNTQACPIDCAVSPWSEWSSCSKECGGGIKERTRSIITHPAFGGKVCPALHEEENCNSDPCPVDCLISDWGPWSECLGPKSCGTGSQIRQRSIVNEAKYGGKPCETDSSYFFESRECSLPACEKADTDWVSATGSGILLPARKCPSGYLTSLSINYTPTDIGIYSIKGKCSDKSELAPLGSTIKGKEETITFPSGTIMGLIHFTTSKLYQIHNKYFPSSRTTQFGVVAKPLRCNEGKVSGYEVKKQGSYLSNIKFLCS